MLLISSRMAQSASSATAVRNSHSSSREERNAMHHDWIVSADIFEDLERLSAFDHEVFRDDLKPVHRRMRVEDRRVVRATEPHTEAQRCKIQAIHRYTDDPAEG